MVFPALRVMHVGDTFPTRDLPIMDMNNGGSGVAFADTLAKAAAVTGVDHDHQRPQPHDDDARRREDVLRVHSRLRTAVQDAKKAGKTVDDVAATWKTPAKYAGYAAPTPARVKADAQVIFDETK